MPEETQHIDVMLLHTPGSCWITEQQHVKAIKNDLFPMNNLFTRDDPRVSIPTVSYKNAPQRLENIISRKYSKHSSSYELCILPS